MVIKSSVPVDLEAALPPRFDLPNIHAYQDMAIPFSRGYPFPCDFCDGMLHKEGEVSSWRAAPLLEPTFSPWPQAKPR